MTTHLEESLQRDAEQIRALISRMTEFAVHTLRACVAAFEKSDRQLCSIIIIRDQRMDRFEQETDRACLEFLLRHQPAAAHLRFVYAALQINLQLERVGDYAESIARQVLKLIDLNCHVPPGMLTDISAASISMLHNAVTAFIREDAALAEVTAQIEEQVDTLRNQVNSELLHLVQNNQLPLAALTPLMTIARRFERVSDQAKSICQEAQYILTGRYAKHSGAETCQILFVDAHHGCLARMAEAIGDALHRPECKFSSAGLDPSPLPAGALEWFARKGLPSTTGGPQPLPPVAEFEQIQVVIAFSETVKKSLPHPSRKSVQLDWSMADPCATGGSADDRAAACERTYATLARQVTQLVTDILGEEVSSPQTTHV